MMNVLSPLNVIYLMRDVVFANDDGGDYYDDNDIRRWLPLLTDADIGLRPINQNTECILGGGGVTFSKHLKKKKDYCKHVYQSNSTGLKQININLFSLNSGSMNWHIHSLLYAETWIEWIHIFIYLPHA